MVHDNQKTKENNMAVCIHFISQFLKKTQQLQQRNTAEQFQSFLLIKKKEIRLGHN